MHEKAVEYLLKAGEKTRRTNLTEAAIGYFQRALVRLEGSALGAGQNGWQIEALKGLGLAYFDIGKVIEAEPLLRRWPLS